MSNTYVHISTLWEHVERLAGTPHFCVTQARQFICAPSAIKYVKKGNIWRKNKHYRKLRNSFFLFVEKSTFDPFPSEKQHCKLSHTHTHSKSANTHTHSVLSPSETDQRSTLLKLRFLFFFFFTAPYCFASTANVFSLSVHVNNNNNKKKTKRGMPLRKTG